MSFIHSSIYYLHVKTLFKVLYLQCIKHFSLKRLLFSIIFIGIFSIFSVLVFVFRLLDEILFFNYRKTEIKNPVFIISNPRSGTTFMHRLMCLDQEKYAYTLLYHTILPSITLFKIINFFGIIDKKIGRPLRRTFDYLDGIFFKGWENIHPMGMNTSEEDEGMYVYTGITPGIFLLCPYIEEIPYVKFPDKMKEKDRRKLMNFYKNSLQRFMYAEGENKIFLSKNVMSTGRLASVLDIFPDAKIIYLIRDPKESIPSFISMFTTAWKAHSPDITDDSDEARAWGYIGIEYYNYFQEMKKNRINSENLVTIKYNELVKAPKETVLKIYNQFNFEVTPKLLERLDQATRKAKKYKSGHSYSLEQYGLSEQEVYNLMKPVYEEYDISPFN